MSVLVQDVVKPVGESITLLYVSFVNLSIKAVDAVPPPKYPIDPLAAGWPNVPAVWIATVLVFKVDWDDDLFLPLIAKVKSVSAKPLSLKVFPVPLKVYVASIWKLSVLKGTDVVLLTTPPVL